MKPYASKESLARLNEFLERAPTRRNVAGYFYRITKVRRTPSHKRRSQGAYQFWAEFEDASGPLPDWFSLSENDLDGILYESPLPCGHWLHGAVGCGKAEG